MANYNVLGVNVLYHSVNEAKDTHLIQQQKYQKAATYFFTSHNMVLVMLLREMFCVFSIVIFNLIFLLI